jgi:hypothetical protein
MSKCRKKGRKKGTGYFFWKEEGKEGDRLLFKYHRMKREPLLNTVGI